VKADRNAPVYGTGEVEVAADPETVWGVLADIGGWPSWNPDITGVTLQGPVRPGTTFRWKSGPGTTTTLKAAIGTGLGRLKAEAERRAAP
jgi:hypothetical protein